MRTTTRRQRKAGPSALPGVRPRGSNQSVQHNAARLVVPQLEDLVAQLPGDQLQSVRAQVTPGERVAIYGDGTRVRVLLVGRERLHQTVPATLAGGWRLLGAVAVEEDGERALPVVWQ